MYNYKSAFPVAVKSLTFASLAAFSSAGVGAGFALIEQGVGGLGNAYAGAAASAQDATTIFFNPAGMTYLQGTHFTVAGHLVRPSAEFSGSATTAVGSPVSGSDGGDAGDLALVPNLYYSREIGDGLRFGLGISAPFGLKTEYDADWVGRYHAIKSELKTVNLNPALAFRATPELSIGFGVNIQYIEATLSQAVNQTITCGGLVQAGILMPANCAGVSGDLTANVEGDDWGYGFNFGVLYDMSPETRVGFSYRSKIRQELEGDAQFTGTAPVFTAIGFFVPTDVTAEVDLPESASLSLFSQLNSQWSLLADATWTRWSRFQELRVDFASNQPDSVTVEDWENSMRYSLGVNYRHSGIWLLRAGIAHDEEPIPSAERRTPRIPGNDRTWLALGANYRHSQTLSFDVGYAHLFVDDTRIDHTSASAGNIAGEYDNSVDILSVQANWGF